MGESTLDHSALLASVSDPHALRAAGNAAYQVGDDMRAKSLYSAALDASNRARAEWIKGAAGDAPAIRRIAKVVYELKDEVQKMQKLKAERAAAKATASHSKQLEQLEEQEKAYEAGYEAARAKLAAKGKLMPREVMELTRPIDNNPVVAAAKLRLLAEHARRFDERRRCALFSGVGASAANRSAARGRLHQLVDARADVTNAIKWDASVGKWRARKAAFEEDLGELRAVQRTALDARAAARELSELNLAGGNETQAAFVPRALSARDEAASRRLWGATRARIDRAEARYTAVLREQQQLASDSATPSAGGGRRSGRVGARVGTTICYEKDLEPQLHALRAFMGLASFLEEDTMRPSGVVSTKGLDRASMGDYEWLVRSITAECPVGFTVPYVDRVGAVGTEHAVERVERERWADSPAACSETGRAYHTGESAGRDGGGESVRYRTARDVPGAGGRLALCLIGSLEDEAHVCVSADSRAFHDRVRLPLCSHYAFGVPCAAAIEAVRAACPNGKLVEMGAGTGYWAGLLRREGLDVLAYDQDVDDGSPMSVTGKGTKLHQVTHSRVVRGTPQDLAHVEDRTLLLCWPPGGDSMAEECLDAYKGDTVVYVGEWDDGTQIGSKVYKTHQYHAGPAETATPEFRRRLIEEFRLVRSVEIPTWPTHADDLTIWARVTDAKGERLLTSADDLEWHGRVDLSILDNSTTRGDRRMR